MHKGRLEAFSDGVMAIIITIMVLELKVPHGDSLEELSKLLPIFISYVLSFIYVGIYWNNHHHMMQTVQKVNGATLWANLHLLFWLSMMPFVTAWAGENHFTQWPMITYGVVLFMCGFAYYILSQVLIAHHGRESLLARAVGSDFKGIISVVIYLIGIGLAFINSWIAFALYACVALIWLIPDRRMERAVR